VPRFEATRQIDVPPETAFLVAADVENYAKFLPLLQRSTIRGARSAEGDSEKFRAELVVAYEALGIREAFVSHVTTDKGKLFVEARSEDGPFKLVTTRWQIKPMGQGSSVTVSIEYALRSPLLQMAVTGLMPKAVEKLMTAFENRAKLMAKTVLVS
jgi:coenzyme Q-binding protein COQ10